MDGNEIFFLSYFGVEFQFYLSLPVDYELFSDGCDAMVESKFGLAHLFVLVWCGEIVTIALQLGVYVVQHSLNALLGFYIVYTIDSIPAKIHINGAAHCHRTTFWSTSQLIE